MNVVDWVSVSENSGTGYCPRYKAVKRLLNVSSNSIQWQWLHANCWRHQLFIDTANGDLSIRLTVPSPSALSRAECTTEHCISHRANCLTTTTLTSLQPRDGRPSLTGDAHYLQPSPRRNLATWRHQFSSVIWTGCREMWTTSIVFARSRLRLVGLSWGSQQISHMKQFSRQIGQSVF